ncbi:uncharacterized protein LOC115318079 [Ixodes scapularis]|uniref:uncharacterized protein LOC115318079 n=1 Tax=Ixodes scapularis TaxID=6945 RepID=UPI001A9FAAA5|nr:uncharacterized protein LOC115318079 [Ixodes scapularis]
MSQYQRIFSVYRTPAIGYDKLEFNTPHQKSGEHVLVIHNGQMFTFNAYDAQGVPHNESRILTQLIRVVQMSPEKVVGVGILTTEDRDVWAKMHATLGQTITGKCNKILETESVLNNWQRRWYFTEASASAAARPNGQSNNNAASRKRGASVTETTEDGEGKINGTDKCTISIDIMSTPHPQQRLGGMPEFNPRSDNIRSYFERHGNSVDINEVPAAKKLKLFLNVVGGQAYEELKKILVPQKPTDKTFEEVRELPEDHFSPEYSVIAERCKFNRGMQQEGESVKDFMTELKHLARNCEIKEFMIEALRDRLVAGLRDEETQRTSFATEGLTFEGASEIPIEKELASRQTSELLKVEARPTEVNVISGSTCGKRTRHDQRTKKKKTSGKRTRHD